MILAGTGQVGRLTINLDPTTNTPTICTDDVAGQLLHLVPADELNRRLAGGRP